jgi:hypothetical protein
MMRFTLALTAMFTLGSLAPLPTVAAQDSVDDLLEYLPGLESAHARKYISSDHLGFSVLASPEATPESALPANSTQVVTVTVLEFENAVIVTGLFGSLLNEELAADIMGRSEIDPSVTEIDNLGDQARLYLGEFERSEEPVVAGLLAVQDGNLGFLISGTGPDDSVVHTLREFAQYMLAADPGDDPVVYGDYADSTGGTFDLLPSAAKHGLFLGTLVPMYDYDLLHVGNHPVEATPESEPT